MRQTARMILCLALSALPAQADSADVWLCGVDPIVRGIMAPGQVSDYMDLFRADAPWALAAKHTQIFKTSTQWLSRAPDPDLIQMFDGLRRSGIKLAVEALMLTGNGTCGQRMEGYAARRTIGTMAQRIRQLGGDLAYVAMDEPLWFGHHARVQGACQSSITDLAREVADSVAAIRHYFPNAKIGDIEPLGNGSQEWIDEIMAWAGAYRDAVGEPLAFVQTDVNWAEPWQDQLRLLRKSLHAAGIPFGIIYNGDPSDPSGEAWVRHAEERFVKVESDPLLVPDHAVLQTWMMHPEHMLPETERGTMTGLVNRHAALATKMTLRCTGDRLSGSLVDAGGKPIVNAHLVFHAIDKGQTDIFEEHHLSGRVPDKAASAVIGLRIGTECRCSGFANISLGPLSYSDVVTGVSVERALMSPGVQAEKSLHGDTEHPMLLNSEPFTVVPGHSFALSYNLRATPESRDSGYVALIFRDGTDREIRRTKAPLIPGTREVAAATTDARGEYSIPLDKRLSTTQPGYQVEFAGDEQHRIATTTCP